MEGLPPQEPRPRKADTIRLDPEVVELHLQAGDPIPAEKARMIGLMKRHVDEFDPEHGPGIARPGEW